MGKLIVVIGADAHRQQFAQGLGHREQYDVSQPPPSQSREVEVQHKVNRGAMTPYLNEERASSVAAGDMARFEAPEREVNWKSSPEYPALDVRGGEPAGARPTGRTPEPEGEEKPKPGMAAKDPEFSDTHISSTDPRQILLQAAQQDMQNVMNGAKVYAQRHAEHQADLQAQARANAERQAQAQQEAQKQPSPAEVIRDVVVIQEAVAAAEEARRSLEQETVIDAEFRVMDSNEVMDAQEAHAQESPQQPAQGPSVVQERPTVQEQEQAERVSMTTHDAESAAHSLDENRTVVITSNEYNPDVARLIEQAQQDGHRVQQDGHRVQTVIIGQQEGDSVKLSAAQMDAVTDLSRDSNYVSVYAPNEEGRIQMYATSYNEQPKLAPEMNNEVGARMQIGIEQRSGMAPDVQSVDTFKPTHPAHTKLESSSRQQQHGADY